MYGIVHHTTFKFKTPSCNYLPYYLVSTMGCTGYGLLYGLWLEGAQAKHINIIPTPCAMIGMICLVVTICHMSGSILLQIFAILWAIQEVHQVWIPLWCVALQCPKQVHRWHVLPMSNDWYDGFESHHDTAWVAPSLHIANKWVFANQGGKPQNGWMPF